MNNYFFSKNSDGTPKIKICGLTDPEEARQCAQMGADAIGLVFYPESRRFVDPGRARQIVEYLPDETMPVGVFVNESFETIMHVAQYTGIRTVQLHGSESPDMVYALTQLGLTVIKALFANYPPWIFEFFRYPADAFLVECPSEDMPGGTGREWDWSKAVGYASSFPLILAGGLTPENVISAVRMVEPCMVDVSSGVEVSSGRKSLVKVKKFIEQVRRSSYINSRSMIL
ncbi:MAG: phosphoribosylanthranilate isomerase [Firmicutes bacterium]|nr:phosphoribosylanthranilate isomerase [Bacillota bacterium]